MSGPSWTLAAPTATECAPLASALRVQAARQPLPSVAWAWAASFIAEACALIRKCREQASGIALALIAGGELPRRRTLRAWLDHGERTPFGYHLPPRSGSAQLESCGAGSSTQTSRPGGTPRCLPRGRRWPRHRSPWPLRRARLERSYRNRRGEVSTGEAAHALRGWCRRATCVVIGSAGATHQSPRAGPR